MNDPENIGPPEPAPEPPPEPPNAWRTDAAGRQFVTLPGRRGPLYRRGEETIQERLDRANRPPDEKPGKGRKRKPPPTPDPPKDVDLKGLEAALAEALRSPAMIAGLAGDVYLASHFTVWGPRLARNLVVSAEHNPWLRRQLEQMAGGGTAAVAVMSLIGLAGGVIAYAGIPIVYLFNIPVPATAREMFQIPQRSPNGSAPPPAPAAPAATPAA